MGFNKVCLHAFGYELPPRVITSAELELQLAPVYDRLKLPLGRLELMSGIRERRFWEPGTKPSQAATLAGRRALANSAINPEQIDCLIFTSVSRDMLEPASASFVHNALGLREQCLTFDLSNACLGFLDGMLMLGNLIEQGMVDRGLIVAGETAENLVDSTVKALIADQTLTRKSIKNSFASLTIGSGAIGLVMGRTDLADTGHYLIDGAWRANTRHNNLCQGNNTGSDILMATDSEELLIRGVETAKSTWDDFLARLDWPPETIDRYFCHQVGRAHAKLLINTLGLDKEKNLETVGYLGNVGSVSAPITMAMGIEQQLLKSGQRAALLGIGSGIACLMLGIEW